MRKQSSFCLFVRTSQYLVHICLHSRYRLRNAYEGTFTCKIFFNYVLILNVAFGSSKSATVVFITLSNLSFTDGLEMAGSNTGSKKKKKIHALR